MKSIKHLVSQVRSRLPSLLLVAAILALNTFFAFAQAGGTGFSSTDLKTGISNSLAVIMMFGFVLGISCVMYGGFAIRSGDVDQGKMSIIGGAIMAAAPAVSQVESDPIESNEPKKTAKQTQPINPGPKRRAAISV